MPDEHSYQKAFKEVVEQHGGLAISLSGSMFMAGMPDLLCISNSGSMLLVENKFWRNKTLPKTSACIEKLLHGPQIAVIKHKLWKRGTPCIVVAQIASELDICYVTYRNNMHCIKWKVLARIICTLPKTFLDIEVFLAIAEKESSL